MRIKEREEAPQQSYKEKLSPFFRYIYNKKTKIIYKIIVLIIVLVIGLFFGLLITGFFGTLNQPSPKVINLARSWGIEGYSLQVLAKGVLTENIKIPFNYVKGLLASPEKLYIDIAFKDYQKIAYKRAEALEKTVLVSSDEDWVPATISDGKKNVKANVRLKGDRADHWITDKWSLRIKISGDETLYGMKSFSIQHPKTRWWLNEFIYQNALKRENVLSVRYKFVEVIINGENKGIYALEEHFAKQLLEHNARREGPIIRFDESILGLGWVEEEDFYFSAVIDSFQSRTSLEDEEKSNQFDIAKNLLESFRLGKLKTSEVFDVDKLAKYFAINTIIGAEHASRFFNIRFYYNPVTARLEPIGFDGYAGSLNLEIMSKYFPNYIGEGKVNNMNDFSKLFFSDKIFWEKYVKELERVSEKEYLDNLFKDLDKDIRKNLDIIHKNYPYYHFDKNIFYDNQIFVKKILNPVKGINAYYQGNKDGKVVLYIGNIIGMPLEITGVSYNNTMTFGSYALLQPYIEGQAVDYEKVEFNILYGFTWQDNMVYDLKVNYRILGLDKIKNESVIPWSYPGVYLGENFVRKKPQLVEDFLEVNETEKTITFKSAVLDKNLIIPAGYKVIAGEGTIIDLINNATILSYSSFDFKGTQENPIKIISSDKTGSFVVLNAPESNFNYVEFRDLTYPVKEGWQLTGAITFYESDVKLNHVLISNMNSEDSINIIRSRYEMRNSVIRDGSFDCFDNDFNTGLIEDSSIINCGNDGLDFSGSRINVKNLKISNVGDKGVSVGEESNVSLNNIEVDKGNIGVASKDLSHAEINGIKISNVKYGFAVYAKKSEYGATSIKAVNVKLENNENSYIVEKGSSLSIDGKIILANKEDVFKFLYPNEQ